MVSLDPAYLNDLTAKVQQGSSNAFAELYSATCQLQYGYAMRMLAGDEEKAKEALQQMYVRALRRISSLQNPSLLCAWLCRQNFRVCGGWREDDTLTLNRTDYTLRQVLSIPIVEAQAVIMRQYQKMQLTEIANLLNMSRADVRRYLRSAERHLKRLQW